MSHMKNKRKSVSIVHKLLKRESFGIKPCTNFHTTRHFLESIFPNFTVVKVNAPDCFGGKFSPDGRHFIAISSDRTSLDVYTFKGSNAGGDMLDMCQNDLACLSHKEHITTSYVRAFAFCTFFKLKFSVRITSGREQLNRECSLFACDGQYVIVGSSIHIADCNAWRFMYSNNDTTRLNPSIPLEDYSLHIVDLNQGKLCSSIQFNFDKIYLSQNQGLCLYKETLAILSVHHQTIHVYHISEGLFTHIGTIGGLSNNDDLNLLSSVYRQMANPNTPRLNLAFRDPKINFLKCRILLYLLNKAQKQTEASGDPEPVRLFNQTFHQIKELVIWKIQLLNERHLLIKYEPENTSITLEASEPNSHPFFVFYNMTTTQVSAVFENTSDEMLSLLENVCDYFRNARVTACFGGYTEAIKKMLAEVPISTQSYNSSPYLDASLFRYDNKWRSAVDQLKTLSEPTTLRFYSRESRSLLFKIYTGLPECCYMRPQCACFVTLIFHPTEPFAISIHRTKQVFSTIVNFHVRFEFCY